MAAIRHNARLAALPCELMRGALFAEDFVTKTRMQNAFGVFYGSGESVSDGYTTAGAAYVKYDSVDTIGDSDYVSIVLRFSTSTTQSTNVLVAGTANYNLTIGTPVSGFHIWVDADGVKANHSDGVSAPTQCEVDLDYADGEIHTVTYLIDMSSGSHSLYVDALDVDTQATTIDANLAGASGIWLTSAGGHPSSTRFSGTLYKMRVFDQLLTEAEHDLYHADTLTSFLDMPTAVWRCDSFGNDTDSNTIHDRTTNANDLYKGDRATAAGFPTFDTDKYLFDLVDDYVSNFPTLPTAYTITGLSSTPQVPYPTIQQHNDTTFSLPLTQAGTYWGYLHSLILHNKTLTQIEKYHDHYQHKYWTWKGRAFAAYHRLITEGVCIFAEFLDADRYVYREYANLRGGLASGVTRGGTDGCTFAAAGNVEFAHESLQQLTEGTIVVYRKPDGSYYDETWVDKLNNYEFRSTSGGNLVLGGTSDSTYAASGWQNAEHIAVTFKSGEVAQFYIEGVYAGDGTGNATLDDTSTSDLIIGNDNALANNASTPIRQVAIFNRVLTEKEIKALFESAKLIGATPMETGNRTTFTAQYTGAISKTVDPGAPFQLIDVKLKWDSAPTTSENVVINSIFGGVTYQEHAFDPSTESETTQTFRFDKRFADNVTIQVTYTNTDANTIDLLVTYQNDDSVN